MRIAFFMNTPAHVHLHKNIISELRKRGHEITVMARDYGDTLKLLNEIGLDYWTYAIAPSSKYMKLLVLPKDVLTASRHLSKWKPRLVIDVGAFGAYSAFLLRSKCIIFNDSEPTMVQFILLKPFVDAVITPDSFSVDLGKKHVRVPTYKELAYLHPKRYSPTRRVRSLLGLGDDEEYALLRFNAFDALHDRGVHGFSIAGKNELVRELSKYGRVYISSEGTLPENLRGCVPSIPKNMIHELVFNAKVVIADTQTIVTEASVLGTPAVRYNSFVGDEDMGNFVELEKEHGLIFNFETEPEAIHKAIELMTTPNLREAWRQKAEKMLASKVDLTDFMIRYIESYDDD